MVQKSKTAQVVSQEGARGQQCLLHDFLQKKQLFSNEIDAEMFFCLIAYLSNKIVMWRTTIR